MEMLANSHLVNITPAKQNVVYRYNKQVSMLLFGSKLANFSMLTC